MTMKYEHIKIISWALIFMFPDYKLTKSIEACGSLDQTPLREWMTSSSSSSSSSSSYSYDGTGAIFIVGCGHSGTTHIINVLSLHPEIKAFGNLPNKEYSVTPHSFGSSKLRFASGILSFQRQDDMNFYKLTKQSGKTHWIVKSPSNVCRLGYIFDRLPNARVIATVRDGRDVFLSLRERLANTYNINNVDKLALNRWIDDNNQVMKWKDDPRVLLVRMEDLSQEKEWDRILSHVGVISRSFKQKNSRNDAVFSGDFLETPPKDSSVISELMWYMFVGTIRSRGEITHNRFRSSQQILNTSDIANSRWRDELSTKEIAMFHENPDVMSLLNTFGYLS